MSDDLYDMEASPDELKRRYHTRDREKESDDRAALRSKCLDTGEISCLSGRAWQYLKQRFDGGPPPQRGGTTIPVACGRKDTERYISWLDLEGLLEYGEPAHGVAAAGDRASVSDTGRRAHYVRAGGRVADGSGRSEP